MRRVALCPIFSVVCQKRMSCLLLLSRAFHTSTFLVSDYGILSQLVGFSKCVTQTASSFFALCCRVISKGFGTRNWTLAMDFKE